MEPYGSLLQIGYLMTADELLNAMLNVDLFNLRHWKALQAFHVSLLGMFAHISKQLVSSIWIGLTEWQRNGLHGPKLAHIVQMRILQPVLQYHGGYDGTGKEKQ